MEFVNRKLEDNFGVKIRKEYEGVNCLEYEIKALFQGII